MDCIFLYLLIFVRVSVSCGQLHGPAFLLEPPTHLTFSNTTGSQVSCSAHGSPPPKVEWIFQDKQLVTAVPGLRQSLGNGTLYFPPFRAQDYRKDVHSTVYRCRATNLVGTIISRQVNVKAVVNQRYEIKVQHSQVIYGNTAVFVCDIPSFVREYVMVTAWSRDDRILLPGLNMGNRLLVTYNSNELHIGSVKAEDTHSQYSCITTHELTQERKRSPSASFTITEPPGSMLPHFSSNVQKNITAERESDIHLKCSAQGNPPPTFNWFREINGHLEMVHTSHRYEIIQDVLLIRKVKIEDGGRWNCKASNRFGEQKLDIHLTVTAHLSVHILPQLQVINSGDVAMFNCSISGLPIGTIEWSKDGKPLIMDERITTSTSLILTIRSINRHDRGMYQCTVYNELESCQGSAELRIGDTIPEMQYTFIEQVLQPGPPVSLRCSATGLPPPQFQWLLDGVPIVDAQISHRYLTGQYVNQQGDVVTHLNISSLRPEDGGLYSCKAYNLLGFATHTGRLNVYGPPAIRSINPITAVAGSNVTIHCPYSGYPIDSVVWSKRGQDLAFDHQHDLPASGSLTISNLNPTTDAGFYTCTVTDRNGQSARKQIELIVSSPPILEPFKFPDNLQVGGRAQVTCYVTSGDMPVHFTWYKDGFPITSSLQVEEQTFEFYTMLIIRIVASTHTGAYTCVAQNFAAQTNYTAYLLVKVPPSWINEPQNQSVLFENPVLINCLAKGSPTPQIEWFKGSGKTGNDYQPLVNIRDRLRLLANHSLWTESSRSYYEGYYLCKATNGVGSGISKAIFLNVNEPPKVDNPLKNMSVVRDKPTTLSCSVYGDTPMTVRWTFEGRTLLSNEEIQLSNSAIENGIRSQVFLGKPTRLNMGVYKCFAQNEYGKSQTIINLAIQEQPSAPTMLEIIKVSSRSLTFAWQRPYNGNNAIQRYLVEYNPVSNAAQQSQIADVKNVTIPIGSIITDRDNPEREIATVDGLIPSTTYSLKLAAVNGISNSQFSDPIVARTQEEAPSSAPAYVHVESPNSDEVLVSWTKPPRETWHGELIGYTIVWKEHDRPFAATNNATVKGWATTQYQLTGLKQFTQYEINVRAFNSVAEGPPSPTVFIVTKEGIPEAAPDNITCSHINSQSIRVAWIAPPKEQQGGHIQGYKVYYQPVDQDPFIFAVGEIKRTSNCNTNLHGLHKYTNYSIRILAYTSAGDGIFSSAIFCMTEEDVPEAPAGIKAISLTSESVLVSWMPPEKPNGRIVHFTVYSRHSGGYGKNASYSVRPEEANITNTLMYEVRGLVEYQTYDFWVSATTMIGEGASTGVVSRITNSRAPSRIASFNQVLKRPVDSNLFLVCVAVGNPRPTTKWTDNRGRAIISSSHYAITTNGHLNVFKLSISLGGNYTCIATNLFGEDAITYNIIVLLPPKAPQLEIQYATTRTIRLRWTQPQSEQSSVQGYTLNVRTDTDDWTILELSPERRTYTLNGLRCGTIYHIYLLAHNRVGNGSRSSVLTTNTTGGPPLLPKEEKLIQTNSSFIQLNLDVWPSGGCKISHFSIQYSQLGKSNWKLVSSSRSVSDDKLVIDGLLSATWYQMQIVAHNEAGSTKMSAYFATRTLTGDSIPTPSSFSNDLPTLHTETKRTKINITSLAIVVSVIIAVIVFLMICFLFLCLSLFRKGRHLFHDITDEDISQPERISQISRRKSSETGTDFSIKSKEQRTSSPVGMYEISPYATFSVPENVNCTVSAATLDYNVRFKTFGHKDAQNINAKQMAKLLGHREQDRRMNKNNSDTDDTSDSSERECFDIPLKFMREADTLPVTDLYRPGSSAESHDMTLTLENQRKPRPTTAFKKRHHGISNRKIVCNASIEFDENSLTNVSSVVFPPRHESANTYIFDRLKSRPKRGSHTSSEV